MECTTLFFDGSIGTDNTIQFGGATTVDSVGILSSLLGTEKLHDCEIGIRYSSSNSCDLIIRLRNSTIPIPKGNSTTSLNMMHKRKHKKKDEDNEWITPT